MANRWKGNIIAATATTSSGTDYTGTANGAWSLNSQLQQKQGGLWAKGQTVPEAPTIGTAIEGDAQATITFTAPSGTGGQAISGYIAKSTPENITGTGAVSPITVTGLTNGTAYTFKVAAINPSGTGAESASSNAVTPSALTPPAAPTIGTATLTGDVSAQITFIPPSNTGGSPITGYTVTSSAGGITASGTSSPITISGLVGNTAQTFTVTATNAIGTGAPSSASNSITTAPEIGDAYGGGFYAGKISLSANGVATHRLVVSPKSTGEASNKKWGPEATLTGVTSDINGPANTTSLAARGASYEAATFCEGLTIGGYSDWYLPAKNELETLYYFLKPTTNANVTSVGSNANAVSPEPISTNYTSGSPPQTNAIAFQSGGTEALSSYTWSSTEVEAQYAWVQLFVNGYQGNSTKSNLFNARAIRRVPI